MNLEGKWIVHQQWNMPGHPGYFFPMEISNNGRVTAYGGFFGTIEETSDGEISMAIAQCSNGNQSVTTYLGKQHGGFVLFGETLGTQSNNSKTTQGTWFARRIFEGESEKEHYVP